MSLRQFVRSNRSEIDRHIRAACSNLGSLNDDAREEWVLNDETLYTWALSQGVPI
jgi:hypothetical protein